MDPAAPRLLSVIWKAGASDLHPMTQEKGLPHEPFPQLPGELGVHSTGCHPLLGSCQMSPRGRTGDCSCSRDKLWAGSNPTDAGSSWLHPAPLGSSPLQSAVLGFGGLCFVCTPPAPWAALASTYTLWDSGVPWLVLGMQGKQRVLGEGAPGEKWRAGACVAVPRKLAGVLGKG